MAAARVALSRKFQAARQNQVVDFQISSHSSLKGHFVVIFTVRFLATVLAKLAIHKANCQFIIFTSREMMAKLAILAMGTAAAKIAKK